MKISFSKSPKTSFFLLSLTSQCLRLHQKSFPELLKKEKGKEDHTTPNHKANAYYFFIADLLDIGRHCWI